MNMNFYMQYLNSEHIAYFFVILTSFLQVNANENNAMLNKIILLKHVLNSVRFNRMQAPGPKQ